MHAQERLLTQLAGILRMADHTLDDAPAQALIGAHERLERARDAREDRVDQGAIPVG